MKRNKETSDNKKEINEFITKISDINFCEKCDLKLEEAFPGCNFFGGGKLFICPDCLEYKRRM